MSFPFNSPVRALREEKAPNAPARVLARSHSAGTIQGRRLNLDFLPPDNELDGLGKMSIKDDPPASPTDIEESNRLSMYAFNICLEKEDGLIEQLVTAMGQSQSWSACSHPVDSGATGCHPCRLIKVNSALARCTLKRRSVVELLLQDSRIPSHLRAILTGHRF